MLHVDPSLRPCTTSSDHRGLKINAVEEEYNGKKSRNPRDHQETSLPTLVDTNNLLESPRSSCYTLTQVSDHALPRVIIAA